MTEELTRIVSGIGPKLRALRSRPACPSQQLAEISPTSPPRRSTRSSRAAWSRRSPPSSSSRERSAVPSAYFVDEEEAAADPTVLHPGRRTAARSSRRTPASTWPGSAGRTAGSCLAGARATVVAGASSGERAMEHPGEELVYLLEGELEFVVDEQLYCLQPGDSLHFRTVQPHFWRNPGTTRRRRALDGPAPPVSRPPVVRPAPSTGRARRRPPGGGPRCAPGEPRLRQPAPRPTSAARRSASPRAAASASASPAASPTGTSSASRPGTRYSRKTGRSLRHHGQPGAHRLQHRQPEALLHGREGERVGGRVPGTACPRRARCRRATTSPPSSSPSRGSSASTASR